MKSLSKFLCASLAVVLASVAVPAQRPRVSESTKEDTAAAAPSAPMSVKAKYEGGVFGYRQKQDGTLNFDDVNQRLVFRNKYQKEVFPIPYAAVISAFADTQARRPTAATVIGSAVPYGLGLPALFIKKKYRYLTLQFSDPDTRVSGITSFKVENKETLAAVVSALANKAGLTQRGEVFVREQDRNSVRAANGISRVSDTSTSRIVQAGLLNSKAIALPRPDYPQDARDANISGTVTVAVMVSEDGTVGEAEAINGPILLRGAAVDAALKAKFTPIKVSGYPAKMSGTLTYDFER